MGYRLRLGPWADYAAGAFLLWLAYRQTRFYFFPYGTALVRYRRDPKAYALVAGISSTVGFGFARELVTRGFGVILLDGGKDALEAAAEQLMTETAGAAVEKIAFNVTRGDYEELGTLLRPYLDLPVTVLVHDVGGRDLEQPFKVLSDLSSTHVDMLLDASVGFMTHLTRLVLPALIRNGPSVAIYVGSATNAEIPQAAIYSGCKAYVSSFATAVSKEAKAEGWKLHSVGVVVDDVHRKEATSMSTSVPMQSRSIAKMVVDRIEMAADRGMTVINPYWWDALLGVLNLPDSIIQFLFKSGVK